MIKVKSIKTDSTAYEAGLRTGDMITHINGVETVDFLDLIFQAGNDQIILDVMGKGQIQADPDDAGFEVEDFVIRGCANNCLFCFVSQLPAGMRKSLYIKDDDYRMSFLYGSYITLTNLYENDFERIGRLHLSPMYVSVHTVDEKVRKTMMNCPSGRNIKDSLKKLTEMGIRLHTQIVVVPGYNDGEALSDSLDYLDGLYPELLTVTVVPVGLTSFRDELKDLRRLTSEEAGGIIRMIDEKAERQKDCHGEKTIYAVDEMYLIAGLTPPLDIMPELYDNGVGMYAQFREDLDYYESEGKLKELDKNAIVCIITSVDGDRILEDVVRRISPHVKRLDIKPVNNKFFGETITVTGLLTGSDIIQDIMNISGEYDRLLIPDVIFNEDDVTLDNISREQMESCDRRIKIVKTEAAGFLEGLK